jgi:diguanylate cyclase (GGDEF)-like protein/PAS domain S-box-containing protein
MAGASPDIERLLIQIVENSPVSMVAFDREFRLLYANKLFARLYGYGRGELLGQPVFRLSAADEPEAFYREAVAIAERDGVWRGDDRRRKKDGSDFPASSSITPLSDDDGGFLCYFDVSRDIWDRAARETELRRRSQRDPLTGLANRGMFDDFFAREWQFARRQAHPLSVLLCDVDFFKRFNDRYGHLAGDDCLIAIAGKLSEVVRTSDLVARYGGEEFTVVLGATDATGAALVAEKIRAGVEETGLAHTDSTVAPVVTVSIGVSTAEPGTRLGRRALLEAADRALYRAKQGGRNRVEADAPREADGGEGDAPDDDARG